MEFLPTAFVLLPMGMLFFTSGLIVNLIQALCYCTLRPFSKNSYRKVNKVVVELLWLELIWLFEWWGGIKIKLFTELETLQVMGKEHALVISNHRSDVDWLLGWVLAQHSGCLGSALGVMKRSLKFLPVMGWSMWFSEYVYLERSWAKDETNLKSSLRRLNDFPLPFWLALFVEGTRFTKAKLLVAQEYAASTGLPLPRNVLIPRTKGFVASVSSLRSFVPAIYDVTVAVPKDEPSPTMLRIFKRKSSVLHVRLKRHLMTELPANDDEISQWCKDIFVSKDNLLDKHLADNTFGEDLYQPMELSLKPPLVIFGWCLLLVFPAFKVLSFLVSTWQGLLCLTVSILSTSVLMQVFIRFSQSEHSTPGQAAPVKSTTCTSNKIVSKENKNM